MSDGSVSAILASYLPREIVKDARERVAGAAWGAKADSFEGAVVFCDISGFTALTEKLSNEGADGGEKLVLFLNEYFGKLVEMVYANGGDVFNFAGDALLAIWRGNPGENLGTVTLRATQCAYQIMNEMNNTSDLTYPRLHMGVGAGAMSLLQVGGQGDRWIFIAAGEPLLQISPACSAASPDLTVLSPEAWTYVGPHCTGTPLGEGLVRLEEVHRTVPVSPVPVGELDPRTTGNLRMYIPRVIQRNTHEGQKTWVAELRRVTIMFINVNNLEMTDASCLDRVHEVVSTIQRSILKYEGIINKMLLDDKGFVVLCGFGLPPQAHENDPERGMRAALLVNESLAAIGVVCSVGLTTGKAFCGIVGSELRREYTMIGDVVNTSARLMTATDDAIRCDKPTMMGALFANHRLEFEQLESRKFKGKKSKMEVFAPLSDAGYTKELKSIETMDLLNVTLVGRSKEAIKMVAAMQELKKDRRGTLLLVEGEGGVGKSRLLEEAKKMAVSQDMDVYSGCGDRVEKSTPFYPFRSVFIKLFGIEEMEHDEAVAAVSDRLKDTAAFLNFLPLLNNVLCLDLEPNSHTQQLRGKHIFDRTAELLIYILFREVATKNTVLVLEDLHLFDSSSKALAAQIASSVPNMLMIFSARPYVHRPKYYQSLMDVQGMQIMRVKPLDKGALAKLVCSRLNVKRLPRLVRDFIFEKCGGNPFFAEEMAYALRDRGIIESVGGRGVVASREALATFKSPESLEGVITARIDSLSLSEALTLKVASAIGESFDVNVLYDIYPSKAERTQLTAQIDADVRSLVAQDFLVHKVAAESDGDGGGGGNNGGEGGSGASGSDSQGSSTSPGKSRSKGSLPLERFAKRRKWSMQAMSSEDRQDLFTFSNAIIHDVAYDLLLFRHKVELHQLTAAWYERHWDTARESTAKLIAKHWIKGEKPAKAVHFLALAAEAAIKLAAYERAQEILKQALDLDIDAVPCLTLVKIYRMMGETAFDLSDEAHAMRWFNAALTMLGEPEMDSLAPLVLERIKVLEMSRFRTMTTQQLQTPFRGLIPQIALSDDDEFDDTIEDEFDTSSSMRRKLVSKDFSKPFKGRKLSISGREHLFSEEDGSSESSPPPVKPRRRSGVSASGNMPRDPRNLPPKPTTTPTSPRRKLSSSTEDALDGSVGSPRRMGAVGKRPARPRKRPPATRNRSVSELPAATATATGVNHGLAGNTPRKPPRRSKPLVVTDERRHQTLKSGFIICDPGWWVASVSYGNTVAKVLSLTSLGFCETDVSWYADYFFQEAHTNLIGKEAATGQSVVISYMPAPEGASTSTGSHQFFVIVRTINGVTTLEVDGSAFRLNKTLKAKHMSEFLDAVVTDVAAVHMMDFVTSSSPSVQSSLLEYERATFSAAYKFGVLYMTDGQSEDDLYHNQEANSRFDNFLSILGDYVNMASFSGYSGDMTAADCDTSVYTVWRNFEVMFQVSTLINYDPEDPRQNRRRNLIEADTVTIVFVDGNQPFSPAGFRSKITKVYVVVQPIILETGGAGYRVGVTCRHGVSEFIKTLSYEPCDAVNLRDYLLTLAINGDRAAYSSATNMAKFRRKRQGLLDAVTRAANL